MAFVSPEESGLLTMGEIDLDLLKEYINDIDLTVSIEETLDNFDFDKVLRTMEALEWKWYFRGDMLSPNLTDLENTSRYLIDKAAFASFRSKQPYTVGTGGFYATVDASDRYVKIWFEVASWESWDED